MSKVTMPEPVGYQWLDTCHFRKKVPKGCNVSEFRGIVTTDQAKAYAASKVREALEEAAKAAESCVCSCCCSDDQQFTAQDAAQRIRALIPSTPA